MHGSRRSRRSRRSQNLWRPSPGSVYPNAQLLVDEGLLVARESEGSKKLFELTTRAARREKIETHRGRRSPTALTPHSSRCATGCPAVGAVAQCARTRRTTSSRKHPRMSTTPARDLQILGESTRRFVVGDGQRSFNAHNHRCRPTQSVRTPSAASVLAPCNYLDPRLGAAARSRSGHRGVARAMELGINHIDTASSTARTSATT